MVFPDPAELARRQVERDRSRPAVKIAGLLSQKIERMSRSPFAFLRGSAPMFYEILKDDPRLANGPDGEGWITGDLHLENFGAFRTEGKRSSSFPVVFDISDFDDAVVGPWRLDVLRLVTSLLLAAQGGLDAGPRSLQACEAMLDGYLDALLHRREVEKPAPVRKLMSRVNRRSAEHLLDERTKVVGKKRRFTRGDRYQNLPMSLEKQARQAFGKYVNALPDKWRHRSRAYEIEDAAFRIAGTGSLGLWRIGIIARGKGPPRGEWLFELKEQLELPPPATLVGEPGVEGAERVETAFRQCLLHPPRMMGRSLFGKRSMLVRRLSPQEDKLDATSFKPEALSDMARYLGSLAGAAHRRGATKAPVRWSKYDRQKLVDHAVVLAGIHEAAYLAYCKLTAG